MISKYGKNNFSVVFLPTLVALCLFCVCMKVRFCTDPGSWDLYTYIEIQERKQSKEKNNANQRDKQSYRKRKLRLESYVWCNLPSNTYNTLDMIWFVRRWMFMFSIIFYIILSSIYLYFGLLICLAFLSFMESRFNLI